MYILFSALHFKTCLPQQSKTTRQTSPLHMTYVGTPRVYMPCIRISHTLTAHEAMSYCNDLSNRKATKVN